MRAILVVTVLASVIFLQPKPAAAHRFNVAFVAPASGPMALPGKQARDGFMLATTERDAHPAQESDGHLGGLDVYVKLVDPGKTPATARAAIGKLIEKGDIDFVITATRPKITAAVHPLVTAAGIFLISTSPAPAVFAGVKCNSFFFSVSWPRFANSNAQSDARENSRPFDAQWTNDLSNPANKTFVATFEKAYRYPPILRAAMGYEAARLIASAVRARDGALSDRTALRAALGKADFQSVRGSFNFNNNQFPIQNRYLARAVRRADGAIISRTVRTISTMRGDRYAANCTMK